MLNKTIRQLLCLTLLTYFNTYAADSQFSLPSVYLSEQFSQLLLDNTYVHETALRLLQNPRAELINHKVAAGNNCQHLLASSDDDFPNLLVALSHQPDFAVWWAQRLTLVIKNSKEVRLLEIDWWTESHLLKFVAGEEATYQIAPKGKWAGEANPSPTFKIKRKPPPLYFDYKRDNGEVVMEENTKAVSDFDQAAEETATQIKSFNKILKSYFHQTDDAEFLMIFFSSFGKLVRSIRQLSGKSTTAEQSKEAQFLANLWLEQIPEQIDIHAYQENTIEAETREVLTERYKQFLIDRELLLQILAP